MQGKDCGGTAEGDKAGLCTNDPAAAHHRRQRQPLRKEFHLQVRVEPTITKTEGHRQLQRRLPKLRGKNW